MDSKEYWKQNAAMPKGRLKGDQWLPRHIENIPPNANVLELGCGEGYDTQYLLSKGCKVISTDLSQDHLDKTKETILRMPKVIGETIDSQLMLLDLTSETDWKKFADSCYDVVVASLCLHYFTPQQTRQIIKEIKRVLKPNGKLFARINSTNDLEHGANDGTPIENENNFRLTKDGTKRFFNKHDIQKFFGQFGGIDTAVERTELYGRKQTKKVLWEISATSDKLID